jgi:hypothetical protein
MKIQALIPALVIASTLAAPAFAQTNSASAGQPSTQKTRAQVHQELIQAQQDGQLAYLKTTVYRGT